MIVLRAVTTAFVLFFAAVSLGAGGLFAVNFVPDSIAPLYGGNNPVGAMGFVRLKLD